MKISSGSFRSLVCLGASALPLLSVLALAPSPANAAELETEQQEVLPEQGIAAPPPETHATQQASQTLLTMAVHEPENLIGKTLVLDDGTDAVTVGPVKAIRRRMQDQQLYLVVDATKYFNTKVDYAVAVSDVDRIEADTLVIPEAPGMHLRGLDYYPDDYTDVQTPVAAPVSEDD